MITLTPEPTAARLLHRPVATGPAYWGPGDHYTFLVTGEASGGAYFAMEALVPPGGGPPPHIHTREDETFYLLEGQIEFVLGEETITAGPGDFVNVPRGTVHCFRNAGTETARMLLTFTPAGIERWFEETLEPAPNEVEVEDVPDNADEVAAATSPQRPGTASSSSRSNARGERANESTYRDGAYRRDAPTRGAPSPRREDGAFMEPRGCNQ